MTEQRERKAVCEIRMVGIKLERGKIGAREGKQGIGNELRGKE